MFLRVPNLLDDDQLRTVTSILDRAFFADGSATAGAVAEGVKNNLQLDREHTPEEDQTTLDRLFAEVVMRHPEIRGALLPRKFLRPRYAKYTKGMAYGVHTDNPLMMEGNVALRTDASITVFLSGPDDYEGGELLIQSDTGETRVKLAKGDAVIYPTGALHAVTEVKSGARLVAVGWIQSMVADPYRRQMLYELDLACRGVNDKLAGSSEARVLTRTYGNLLRLWGEI